MRQNPMLSSRVQVGGRQMPQWFSASMVNPPRATMSTPPPLPAEPPPTTPDESEYEEIDHLPRLNGSRRSRIRRVCNLCGTSNAVVVCEMCEDQIFCGGCNDMYHRHPKRLNHQRKLLDPGIGRPPLPPPKAFPTHNNTVPQQDGGGSPQIVSSLPPVPPPRTRNKRFLPFGIGMRSAGSTPTLTRKVFDPMSTLKRFVGGMGQRPLPPTPKQGPPLPPKPADFGRPITPTMNMMRGESVAPFDRRHSSPAPSMGMQQNFPMDRRYVPQQQQQMMHEYPGGIRHQSASIANLTMQRPPSRGNNNGYPDWEEQQQVQHFPRERAQSVSVQRFPNSSQDSSHFATLQRPRRGPTSSNTNINNNSAPERPPPPLPPRSYPSQSQLGFQSSQSAFNINHMGMSPQQQQQQFGGMPSWNYPGPGGQAGFPMDFQQAAMMGYPNSMMRRTPSNQSMGGGGQQQGFFGWGGGPTFGPPMTQQEMEFELLARHRGSTESSGWSGQGHHQQFQSAQPPPRPPSVTQSQPVTPQGSFRRKSRPPPPAIRQQQQEEQIRRQEQAISMNDHTRYNQNNQQRSSTPRGALNRMNQSPINFQETLRDLEEDARIEYQATSSDSPEGPWTCKHCTFINPMSTNICTICCKTHRSSQATSNKKSTSGGESSGEGGGGGKSEMFPRKGSSSSTNEEMPVIQSKLSISRGDQQQATINLIESVERVRTPTKIGKKDKQRPAYPTANNKTKVVKTANEDEEDEDEEEQEEEEDEEEEDEEISNQAQHHRMKIDTKKTKIISAKSNVKNDSNEDVYGTPIQAITISPKIDIRRHHPKTMGTTTTSTGVGSSPPSTQEQIRLESKKPMLIKKKPVDDQSTTASTGNGKAVPTKPIKPISKKSDTENTTPSFSGDKPNNKNKRNASSSSTSTSTTSSSSSSKSDSIKKPVLSKKLETTPPSSSLNSTTPTKQTVSSSASTTTSVQATVVKSGSKTVPHGESGSESNQSGTTSSGSSQSIGIASSIEGQGEKKKEDMSMAMIPISNNNNSTKLERKSSKGTSPPPQSISTQTYEELPSRQKSMSKTSMQSLQSDDYSFSRPIEMSEKALRYARKAKANKHHHEEKLKRSLSTHLYSTSEPWVDLDEMVDGHGRSLYRSSSRHSLLSDTRSLPLSGPPSRDSSPPPRSGGGGRYFDDFRQFGPPSWDRFPTTPEDYFASFEDLVTRRPSRKNSIQAQDFELSRLLKEAEDYNFSPEDVQVALKMCGERNPVKWLQENWSSMIETVQTLATKYGREKGENNQTGTVSSTEAKNALRTNKGNVWAAVTECIEQRRKKFRELQSRGTFSPEDILTALTANHGNLDAAYVELSKAQLKPFLMKIWNDAAAVPPPTPSNSDKQSDHEKSTPSKDNDKTQDSRQIVNQNVVDIPLEKLEPEPRLELLVSNAARVSQEIEKAIQELKQSKNQSAIVESGSKIPILARQQEAEPEEENFVDAVSAPEVSDTEIQFSSPLPMMQERDAEEEFADIVNDKTQANISESMQEAPQVKVGEDGVNTQPNDSIIKQLVLEQLVGSTTPQQQQAQISINKNTNDDYSTQQSLNPTQESSQIISPTEIEQLLTTLTTTFTEMGQFATDIKAQIASEIQQQLAAAKGGSKIEATKDIERVYEPVTLSESVSQNVDKKIAKYKRLAAKKEQKSTNRHKSPDARNSRLSKSRSPSPGSSLAPSSSSPGLLGGLSDPEGDIPDLASSPFPNNAQVIIGVDTVDDDQSLPPQDGLIIRDEGEYNSAPDDESGSEEEEEEISDEDIEGSFEQGSRSEEIEEVEEEEESDIVVSGSSENDEERGLIEGAYEEINVNRSDFGEIYNNKDTENKDLTTATNNDTKHFVPSPLAENVERESLPVVAELKREEVGGLDVIKTEKENKIDRFMKDGKIETEEKAALAVQLIDMNFSEEDSVYAANECSSLYSALSFLQQECDLCAGKFSVRQMVSMLRCVHVCCHNCAKEYFTVQIRDKSIVDATCPFCSEPPNLNDDPEGATEYFNHLDILLKSILEPRHHEMFQRKLRDWALAKTPNFKWCSKCSSGFITEPLQSRLICPDCNAVTCAICLEQWDKSNHYHRGESKVKVCDSSSKTIVDYLNENCVECPRCHFRFSLARGGCMHLTCTQCRHEFCSGCSASFRMGDKCDAKLPICDRLGLHAHHPRNCLFYLRDKEPDILGKLLEESAIPYLKENSGSPNDDNPSKTRTCQVPIQKETSDGLKDDICGKDAPTGYATVCEGHYIEYLGLLIWQNHLDPISILTCDDLEVIIRRANKKHPGRPFSTSDEAFRNRLLKVIQDEIPL